MHASMRLGLLGVFLLSGALGCGPHSEPRAATPAPAVAPLPPAASAAAQSAPLDDPNSCVDAARKTDELTKRGDAARIDHTTIMAKIQSRIIERSDAIRSCRPAAAKRDEVDLEVELLPDGSTRAKVVGATLSECAAIQCVREKIGGFVVAAPEADMHHTYRWRLVIEEQGPVYLAPGQLSGAWDGRSPESTAACLDQAATKDKAGRVPPQVVRNIVRSHYGYIRKCYEAGLGRHRDLKGRVTMRFVIGLDGNAADVEINANDLPDCAVARCIRDVFKPMRFPKPEGGIVTVQYPIMLEPG